MKEKVGEVLIKKNGCCQVFKVYYRGEIAGGKIIQGYTGIETELIENRIKPNHIVIFRKNGIV